MDLTEGAELVALRGQLREYFAGLLTAEDHKEIVERGLTGQAYREKVVQRLGRDGWLGLSWPKEFGGQERTIEEQQVFFEELSRARIPFPNYVNTVGPTLIYRGTKEQQERFLPAIVRGELMFSIGYTEPEAGTDLASLRTRATKDGDNWVINGSKLFTSWAHISDYIWLAARTDPDAPKHKGITVFMVPTTSEGFTAQLLTLITDHPTCATFYDSVRIPDANRVGEVNGGWELMTSLLKRERVAIASSGGRTMELWQQSLNACRESGRFELPWVRALLARTRVEIEAINLLNKRLAASLARDELSAADASAIKIFSTEHGLSVQAALQRATGPGAQIRHDQPGAVNNGLVETAIRNSLPETFGGGSNGVMRDVVAVAGLGLPRAGR